MSESQQPAHHALLVDPTVAQCIAHRAPVVGLETAVFTHGLPPNEALPCLRDLESAVAAHGAQPATCAVVKGRARVGMDGPTLERMLISRPYKATPSTLPWLMATGRWAGTTAGATMLLAWRAGISVVATGGIGGVHRGAEGDVSADLRCLATLPLVVVCSGAKSILDLPRTVEMLETLGVSVLGYQTSELPGFYTRSTGIPVMARVDTPNEIAEAWCAARDVGSSSSILVCNPPPAEHAMDPEKVEAAVARALLEPHYGPSATPLHLARVQDYLGPDSIRLNRALLRANAALAADVAALIAQGGRYSR